MPAWKKVIVSGSQAQLAGVTGSLLGTASYAITASYSAIALTASYALNAAGGAFGGAVKLNQSVAASTWSLQHNLGENYPVVNVYNTANDVIIPGRIESVDANSIRVYFDAPTAGTVVAMVGGAASVVSYITSSLTIGTTAMSTSVTSSLLATTTTISRVSTASYSGAFWDYVVSNGINYRAGTVMGVWNKAGSAAYTDNSTPDIGNTSTITFSVAISGDIANLNATTTTTGWNVKTFLRTL